MKLKRRRMLLRLESLEDRSVPTIVIPAIAETMADAGLTHTAASTTGVAVEPSGTVDVVLTLTDTSGSSVLVRRFQPNGMPLASNSTITVAGGAAGAVDHGQIALNTMTGQFVVVYDAPSSNNFQTLFAQVYSGDGTPQGSPIAVATSDVGSGNQIEPAVATTNTNFYISWTDQNSPTTSAVRVRGFLWNGQAVTPADVLVSAANTNQRESSVAVQGVRGNTGILVAYTQDSATSGSDVFLRDFNGDFTPFGAAMRINTPAGTASQPSIGVNDLARIVVAWRDTSNPSAVEIRFNYMSAGEQHVISSIVPFFLVPSGAGVGSDLSRPRVAVDQKDGRFIIAYRDGGQTPSRIEYVEYSSLGLQQTARRNFTDHVAAQGAPAVAACDQGVLAIAADDNFAGADDPWFRTFRRLPPTLFAVGGAPGLVQVRNSSDGSLKYEFSPFGSSYTGPISVAWGDVNGDGYPDLVVGAKAGNPNVAVYDGKAIVTGTFSPSYLATSQLVQFFAFGTGFNVGVNVAAGDVQGDGYADIVTGASAGNPDVRVFRGGDIANHSFNPTGRSLYTQFFAYGLNFNIGVNVAAGFVRDTAFADIVTGPTAGNPEVRVYDGGSLALPTYPFVPSLESEFFPYGINANLGVNIAVGDVTGLGDGEQKIITSTTAGNPQVLAFQLQNLNFFANFFPYVLNANLDATVASADFEGNGHFDILTGSTQSPHFRIVNGQAFGVMPPAVNNVDVTVPVMQGGITVAAWGL